MTANKSLCFALLLLLAAGAGFCADKDTVSADELLAQARRLEVWSEGSPAVTMQAELSIADPKNGTVHGSYALVWKSTTHWKDQIHFANYDRVRVRDGQTLWQKSSLDYQPLVIFQLDNLLNAKDELSFLPNQKLKRSSRRKERGAEDTCTAVQWDTGTARTLCFDPVSGALVRVDYPTGESQNTPAINRIEYGSFAMVEGKLVPNEVQAYRDRQMVAEVKITEISKPTGNSLTELNPPPGAEAWPTCDDLLAPVLTTHVSPRYPQSARDHHVEGRVTFYAVVEADGTLSRLRPIEGTDPSLLAATAQALSQWRYKPATCGQTPVRMETSVSADFWLRY